MLLRAFAGYDLESLLGTFLDVYGLAEERFQTEMFCQLNF